MKKKELLRTLYRLYPKEDLDLKTKDFLSLVREEDLCWLELDNEVIFHAQSLSKAVGKHPTDYSANFHFRKRKEVLKGYGFQLGEHESSNSIKLAIKARYPHINLGVKTHFVDWHMAYSYVSISSKAIVYSKTVENEPLGVIFNDGALYLDSRLVSDQLNVEHASLISLMDKYKEELQDLGKLEDRYTNQVNSKGETALLKSYLLNEDHAYFLGTLARNTESAVCFKHWLVQQFRKAREVILYQESQLDTEEIIHRQLCELSMYTSLKVQSEYPLEIAEEGTGGLKKSIKRIDLLIGGSIGIELKKNKITNEILMEVIGNRGYYHTLKKINGFKYLVVSSPVGITPTAERMLEVMSPKVIFLYPHQIGEQLAKQALKEYPIEAHWWLKKMVFPKFSRVLSKEFLEVFLEKPAYILQS